MAEVQFDSIAFAVNTHANIIAREEKVKQQPDQLQTHSQRAWRATVRQNHLTSLISSDLLCHSIITRLKGTVISKANESEI